MSARDRLVELVLKNEPDFGNTMFIGLDGCAMSAEEMKGSVLLWLDAYRAEVQRELIHKMRGQLAAGLKMPVFATVMVADGSFEPMSTTHILDAWDPDREGAMRPAAEALEELRGWPAP